MVKYTISRSEADSELVTVQQCVFCSQQSQHVGHVAAVRKHSVALFPFRTFSFKPVFFFFPLAKVRIPMHDVVKDQGQNIPCRALKQDFTASDLQNCY